MSEEISPLENHGWWMEQLRKDAKANRPEALRLAAELAAELGYFKLCGKAAAELRRLHGLDFALRDCELALQKMATKYMDAVDQRDALLEALKSAAEYLHDKSGCLWLRSDFQRGCRCSEDCSSIAVWKQARAAIARAEGEKT
jgi:hypothetical protein